MDNTVPTNQQRPTQQPVAQPNIPQVSAEPLSQPVSGPNKEFEPMTSSSPSEQGAAEHDDEDEIKVARQEVMLGQKVAPTKEVQVSEELKEAGVEQGSDVEQEIPVVVQQAGMRVSSSDSAIPVSAVPSVKMPITYAHAVQLDKHSKIKESIKWLAREIKRQWERLQLTEKEPTV